MTSVGCSHGSFLSPCCNPKQLHFPFVSYPTTTLPQSLRFSIPFSRSFYCFGQAYSGFLQASASSSVRQKNVFLIVLLPSYSFLEDQSGNGTVGARNELELIGWQDEIKTFTFLSLGIPKSSSAFVSALLTNGSQFMEYTNNRGRRRRSPQFGCHHHYSPNTKKRTEDRERHGSLQEMDVILVKNEENSSCVRRRLSVMEGEANKCIKRRRRDPLAMVGRSDQDKNGEKPDDQSAAATTTTAAKRSSRFRGVSRHRWTGRFEAHLWDKGSWNVTQKKKGKQVYLGAYDEEESAARAYDLAALKYWGPTTFTNFPVSDYEKEIQIMQNVTKEEYLASLRRKSSGFSRGVSKYRGVARHHHNGRWEARIGRVFGNKYLYLGTYSTQEEAAAAYDIAAIEYRGINAVTNFDLSTYIRWLRPGSNNLLAPQESRPSAEHRAVALVPTTSNFQKEEPDTCFQYNPFIQDDLCSPHKQEFQSRQISNISCNKSSSSPTALGLLLRSSIFRELVEKNSSAAESELEGDDVRQRQQITVSDDYYPGVFYDGIADVPLLCSNNGVTLPEIELQEESGGSYYDRSGQALWNNVLNMSSID